MNKEKVIPDPLYEDIKSHHSVLFAGSGISTECEPYGKPSFYDIIMHKAEYPKQKKQPAFPELMQYYCDHIDGGQRNRLTREIIKRISFFAAPGEINNFATMFHNLTAEIPHFDRIVTTNWDPFFERALNILVPMVEDKDLAFWHDKAKQVLKIHGCVTRPYTLIATRDDYRACIQRYPLIFNKLRDLIVTRTFVFVGYSLQDSDFRLIFDDITSRLGTIRKLAYAYDLKASDESIEYWRLRGVQVLKFPGVALMYELRDRLEKDDLKPSRKLISFFTVQAERIRIIHHEHAGFSSPGAFISAMYQDGLLHSISEVVTFDSLGQNDDFEKEEKDLAKTLKRMIRKEDLVEIAYFTGRLEVVQRFNKKNTSKIPAYFDVARLKPSNVFHTYEKQVANKTTHSNA